MDELSSTTGIVALAAGGVWIYSYKKISDTEKEVDTLPEDDPRITELNNRGEKYSTITFVTGPLTVVAGGVFVYSVVRGFIAPGKRKPKESSPPGSVTLHKKGKTTVTLTPVVTPEGGAATFRIDW